MDQQKQNNGDGLARGFLVKDKSGHLKKVQNGTLIDYTLKEVHAEPAIESDPRESEAPTPPAPPQPTTPAQQVSAPSSEAHAATTPLQPSAPISASDTAPLEMEPEDAAEIKQHEANLREITGAKQLDASVVINAIIENIIHEHGVTFEDDILLKRFTNVLESKLRDIRNSIETKEVLIRQKKVGGLELSEEIADKVIASAEREAKKLNQKGLIDQEGGQPKTAPVPSEISMPKTNESAPASAPPPFVPRPGEKKEIQEKPVSPEHIIKEEPKPALPEPVVKMQQETVQSETEPKPIPPIEKEEPVQQAPIKEERPPKQEERPAAPEPSTTEALYSVPTEEMPRRVNLQAQTPDERPQVIDIKQPMKIVGPVEELGDIDLKEFRRLGQSPQEAADKIFEKVELLEEDSWQARMDGLNAWKQSPVHKLYVEIGKESIESNTTVEELIRKRMEANKPYKVLDEFFAINNLNDALAI